MANQNAIDAAKAAGTLCRHCGKVSKKLVEKIKEISGAIVTNRQYFCACVDGE